MGFLLFGHTLVLRHKQHQRCVHDLVCDFGLGLLPPRVVPCSAVKLLFSLLPAQQAELEHRLGWLRQVWILVKRAIVVKVRPGLGQEGGGGVPQLVCN